MIHELRLSLGCGCDAKWVLELHVEMKTRWNGCQLKSNQLSNRQRERLMRPAAEANYWLVVIKDAHKLFENPPSPPHIRIYKPPSYDEA